MTKKTGYSTRAFIALYRQRCGKSFTEADRFLSQWARERADPGGDVVVRSICSVYGQFDFVVLVDAINLKALHLSVQGLGSSDAIGDTETFIVNKPATELGETFIDHSYPLRDCQKAVLCLRVAYGAAFNCDFDETVFALYRARSMESGLPSDQTFSDSVAQYLRDADDRVLVAEAVFGKFDILAILDDQEISEASGARTIHGLLNDLVVEQLSVRKTALLRPCPISSESQFI